MGGQGDLLGAAAAEADAQVGGAVSLRRGTTAAGLSAAQCPDQDAAPQDLLERGKLFESTAPTAKKGSHVLHSYTRKTIACASPQVQGCEGPTRVAGKPC